MINEFRAAYLAYAGSATDAHPMAHEAVFDAIGCLLLGRGWGLQFGHKLLRPTRWIVLVGPSTDSRKSTSIKDIGEQLIAAVNPALIGPDSIVVERLWNHLRDNPVSCIFADEFATLLRDAGKEYNSGLTEMLTKLYDCPPLLSRRVKDQHIELRNPFLSLLAGTTAEWLVDNFKEGDIAGGFFSRMELFLLPPRVKTYAVPPAPNQATFNQLRDTAAMLHAMQPRTLTLSDTGAAEYGAWRQRCSQTDKKLPQFDSAFERLYISVLKSSLLRAVLNGHTSVTAIDVCEAARLGDAARGGLSGLVAHLTFSPWERQVRKVQGALNAAWAPRSKLLLLTKLRPRELDETLSYLFQAKQAEELRSENNEPLYRRL